MATRYVNVRAGEESPDVLDLEGVFALHYGRVVRVIAKIIRNPGRAEELAVEAFLRLAHARTEPVAAVGAWLTKTAIRLALDEIRRRERRERFDRLAGLFGMIRTPEEILIDSSRHARVTGVLRRLKRRDSELLLLKAEGLSYEELAATLSIHPASVGTFLSRAQEAFRKEYVKRYGME